MGKCVVKNCESRSEKHNKSNNITFHRLPKDPERRVKWVKIIRLLRKETDWLPTKFTIICSKHFRDQDKIDPKRDFGRVYLSNDAIPILIDDNNSEEHEHSLEENMNVAIVETDEEIEEITESPKEHKMRQIIHRLKSVATRRLRKIKNLSQINKTLKIKNKKLKELLEELQGRRTLSEEEIMLLKLNEPIVQLVEEFQNT